MRQRILLPDYEDITLQFESVIAKQFLRFALIGLASNLILFLAYLLTTQQGLGHKTAMTVLYTVGVSVTFIFNRNWTFSHRGHVTKTFAAYVLIYALGYVLNLAVLYVLVDKFGFRHQWVQGFMILILAVLLFILQKYLVFKKA